MPSPTSSSTTVIVPDVSRVDWVSKNVFLATFSGSSASSPPAAPTGFQLSFVDVVVTTHPMADVIMKDILERLNRADTFRKALRWHSCERLPLEGWGDIVSLKDGAAIAGEDHDDDDTFSLQVELVRRGMARVTRPAPSKMLARLLRAEEVGLTAPISSGGCGHFARRVAAWERHNVSRKASGVVVDVVRGDWMRVLITAESSASTPSSSLLQSVVLVRAAGVTCGDLRQNVSLGYAAWRFAQQTLFHCKVVLDIYKYVPSDKTQANNTQMVDCDQLEHLVATVWLQSDITMTPTSTLPLPSISPTFLPASIVRPDVRDELTVRAISRLEKQVPEQDRRRWSALRDFDVVVVPPYPQQPAVGGCCCITAKEMDKAISSAGGDWSRVLVRFRLAKLLQSAFMLPRSSNYLSLLDVAAIAMDEATSVLAGWQRVLADSDPLQDPQEGMRVRHLWAPAKTLWSLSYAASSSLTLEGHIESVKRVRVTNSQPSPSPLSSEPVQQVDQFLRVSVCVESPEAVVQAFHDERLLESGGLVAMTCPASVHVPEQKLSDAWAERQRLLDDPKERVQFPLIIEVSKKECYGPKLTCGFRFTPARPKHGEEAAIDPATCLISVIIEPIPLLLPNSSTTAATSTQEERDTTGGAGGDAASIGDGATGGCASDEASFRVLMDAKHCDVRVQSLRKVDPAGSAGTPADQPCTAEVSLPAGVESMAFALSARVLCGTTIIASCRRVVFLHHSGGSACSTDTYSDEAQASQPPSSSDPLLVMEPPELSDEFIACRDHDDAEEPSAQPMGSNAQASRVPTSPLQECNSSPLSSLCMPTVVYHSLMDVYLPMPRIDMHAEGSEGIAVEDDVFWALVETEWQHSLRFKAVTVVCERVIAVNGRRGLVARLLEPNPRSPYVADLVGTGTETDGVGTTSWQPCSPFHPLLRVFTAAVDPATLLPEYGAPEPIVDADGTVAPAVFPGVLTSKIPLLSFSVAPRQLFASHPKHHRNVIPEADKAHARGYAHIDAAFMLLNFPSLPSLLRVNWEQLPYSVLDVQAAVVESLHRPAESGGRAPQWCLKPELSRKLSPATKLVAFEKPMVSLLTALLLLAPRNTNESLRRTTAVSHCVVSEEHGAANLMVKESTHRGSGVLYAALRTPTADSHGSASVASRVLVFGQKQSTVEAALLDPSATLTPNLLTPASLHTLLAAMANVACGSKSQQRVATSPLPWWAIYCGDDAQRPLGDIGLGQRGGDQAVGSTSWLYTPLSHVGVIASPLFSKEEETDEGGQVAKKLATVAVHYIPTRTSGGRTGNSLQQAYRHVSYGQVGRDVIFGHYVRQANQGRLLVDYASLMLRRRRDGSLPEGLLKVYGNALEPLYLFYSHRHVLRHTLSLQFDWSSINQGTHASSSALSSASQIESDEKQLFDQLLSVAERILWNISVATNGVPVYVAIETVNHGAAPSGEAEATKCASSGSAATCTLRVYPISDGNDVTNHLSEKPHAFRMHGNVFGRLPLVQVRCWWVGGDELIAHDLVRMKDSQSTEAATL